MPTPPEVSILLPSYNYGRYLKEAIDSVLSQTFSDFELLILDDGSSDDSFAIAQAAADADLRVVAWRQDNQGIPETLNQLYSRSRGRYVAQLGSDDVWLPRRLQLGVDALREDPDLVATFCSFFVIDGDGAAYPRTCHFVLGEQQGEALYNRIVVQNCLCACTAMIRREALSDDEPYSRDLALTQDWDLWLRIGQKGKIRLRKEVGALYRWHESNLTQVLPERGLKEHRFVYEDFCLPLTLQPAYAAARAGVLSRLVYYCWQLGDRTSSCAYLSQLATHRVLTPAEELQRIVGLHELRRLDDARHYITTTSSAAKEWPAQYRELFDKLCAASYLKSEAATNIIV